MGSVSVTQKSSWSITLQLGRKDVSFKLDTGAEVTAISDSLYKLLGRIKLQKPSKILHGPARQTLDVLGQFTETLTYKNKSVSQAVFVVRGLKCNLLGFPAITSLQLLNRVDAAHAEVEDQDIRKLFPNLFTGVGNLGEEYEIKLKDGAVPHSLFTARNVPIPLRQKVREELDRMEAMGVISRVCEPTQWCAGMVVVPKKSGAVRICVDLKPLNGNVLRETHPIPKVD